MNMRRSAELIFGFTLLLSTLLVIPVGYGDWTDQVTINLGASSAPPTAIASTIKVTPQSLNKGSGNSGNEVQASVSFPGGLPAGCTLANIDVATVRLRVLGGNATVAGQHAHGGGTNKRHFKFDRDSVVAISVGPARWVTYEVFGNAGSCIFSGTDTIWYDPPVGKVGTASSISMMGGTELDVPDGDAPLLVADESLSTDPEASQVDVSATPLAVEDDTLEAEATEQAASEQ
jgi:hypothetical protein